MKRSGRLFLSLFLRNSKVLCHWRTGAGFGVLQSVDFDCDCDGWRTENLKLGRNYDLSAHVSTFLYTCTRVTGALYTCL